jgi:hypothetical protein
MVRLGNNFGWAVLLTAAIAVPACSQSASPSAGATQPAAKTQATAPSPSAAQTKRVHRKKKPDAAAQVPVTPPPPPTLDQQPPTPPQVSYRNGLLSINAPNSTLASVLKAVQAQTGAAVEVPSAAQNDRVVMAIGPGQPRDVLNTLLNGSTFDYMIVGVAGRPGAVQRVILTPKSAGGTAQANNAPPPSASQEQPVDDNVAESSGESEYPGPTPEPPGMPPGAFRRPMGAPGGQAYQQQQMENQNQDNPFPPGQSDNVVKTPEQLMQELQQMQQQQQQYQEQLNPANQQPPQ